MSSATPAAVVRVAVGVDTHKDVHVAAARDGVGRPLGQLQVPVTAAGYRQLLRWARSLGEPIGFGVEGTGSFGAALSRFLRREGERVVEVNRPNRQARRRNGKSDPVDADAAARAVLSGDADVTPKHADGAVEMIRVLRVARASAVKATSETVNAIHAIVLTAPEELRAPVRRAEQEPAGPRGRRPARGGGHGRGVGGVGGAAVAGSAV
ncbi:MAG: transposase [Mycobacteriales bacterium]